ncbi:hypothetical protein L2E82_45218 [Cichorium intybus]|uniref:Uncharacterized protein n=1 Tax=Cichorium intybus TaxID=13427 RepID=A0ACB8ZRE3_CICIN|nr:hypothetical protein L2E82_45218 [Cichorium intybus]
MLLQSQRNVDGDWMRWIGPVTMAIGGVGSLEQTTSTMAIGGAGYDPLILVASDQFYEDKDETSSESLLKSISLQSLFFGLRLEHHLISRVLQFIPTIGTSTTGVEETTRSCDWCGGAATTGSGGG